MHRATFLLCLACAFFAHTFLLSQTSGTGGEKVYLGFLDDAREEMANWKPGVASQRLIRPAFEKDASGWKSIHPSSMASHMRWTIAFDGKNIGEVDTERVSNETRLELTSSNPLTLVQTIQTPAPGIPSVGAPSQNFAGAMSIGTTKVRRPLVAISKPYFRDPDGWKRVPKLPDGIAAQVRAAFRREFPHVDRCKDEEIVEHDWKFPDSLLDLPISYDSNKHSFMVQTNLNAGNCGYVDDPNDPLSKPWFFISETGNVRRIGSFMTLLDAGDYDNDGRSELIFFLSQPEDTDGFLLFDADLHKLVDLTWSYH